MLTVVIPWRRQDSRVAALDAVVAWYRDTLDDVDIRLVDSDDEIFNLSRARNLGVASVVDPDAAVIINDADTIPEREPLLEAVAAATHSGRVHLPYTRYHWLGASGSAQFATGIDLADCDFELVNGACSGVYVTTPRTWANHGGQDERFRGWGFEDAAWYLAHGAILGEPPRRSTGTVYALHHAAEVRRGAQYDANAALMERYRSVAADPDGMRALVSESAANALLLPGA